MIQSNGGPFRGHVFDQDGKREKTSVVCLETVSLTVEWLRTQVHMIRIGREVMVEDSDGYCVFHAKDGQILFPTL